MEFFWGVKLPWTIPTYFYCTCFRSNLNDELEVKSLNDTSFSEKFSYWKNNGTEPLKNMTIGNLIKESAIIYEDRIAVSSVYQNEELTYSQLYDLVRINKFDLSVMQMYLVHLRMSSLISVLNLPPEFLKRLGIISDRIVCGWFGCSESKERRPCRYMGT